MRKMILDEVYRFRQQVRTAPGSPGQGHLGQQTAPAQLPMPSGGQQWKS